MSDLLLSINRLSPAFPANEPGLPPKDVLKQISLTLNKGETLAVVGESGSGKSLTAHSCLGLQPENALIQGSIHFNGQELIGATDEHLQKVRGKHVGMVFQEPMTALNPLHTIGQQIKEMLDIHQQMTRAQALERVKELLDSVGLAHFKDRLDAYPHQLSGGE